MPHFGCNRLEYYFNFPDYYSDLIIIVITYFCNLLIIKLSMQSMGGLVCSFVKYFFLPYNLFQFFTVDHVIKYGPFLVEECSLKALPTRQCRKKLETRVHSIYCPSTTFLISSFFPLYFI